MAGGVYSMTKSNQKTKLKASMADWNWPSLRRLQFHRLCWAGRKESFSFHYQRTNQVAGGLSGQQYVFERRNHLVTKYFCHLRVLRAPFFGSSFVSFLPYNIGF